MTWLDNFGTQFAPFVWVRIVIITQNSQIYMKYLFKFFLQSTRFYLKKKSLHSFCNHNKFINISSLTSCMIKMCLEITPKIWVSLKIRALKITQINTFKHYYFNVICKHILIIQFYSKSI